MISFLSPWLLAGLLTVPLLWWLLRLLPPRPRVQRLPTLFLLKDVSAKMETPAHMPWWLLALRAAIAVCLVLAFAGPVLQKNIVKGGQGPLLLVIDNGWAAAANWDQRIARAGDFANSAGQDGRAIYIVPTAPDATDGAIRLSGPMTARDAAQTLAQLKPQPWPADHGRAAAGIEKLSGLGSAIFLSDGLSPSDTDTKKLFDAMTAASGAITLVRDRSTNNPFILRRVIKKPGELSFSLERLAQNKSETLILTAQTAEGNVLDQKEIIIPANEKGADMDWDILPDLRNQVARIAIASPRMASAIYLTDSRWQQHPVGIVANAGQGRNQSFLNEIYYLKRALEDGGAVDIGTADELTQKKLSAILWPDSATLTAQEREKLAAWVQGGGFLIRFAGANLAAETEDDGLVPVSLRAGQRAMQGALTWDKPLHMADAPKDSPLADIAIPQDSTVSRQVLAEATPETFERTWAQLEDGTPLITAAKNGQGFEVLVHTTAGPDWSNLCYSGFYVEALQRMISLSAGIAGYDADAARQPLMLEDGFGTLAPVKNGSAAAALMPGKSFVPSPQTPPGLYGTSQQYAVYNLGDALPGMSELSAVPAGVHEESYAPDGNHSLRGALMIIALLLLLADTAVTLWLRGLLPHIARASAAAVIAILIAIHPARAEETADMVTGIYLGYIQTGDQQIDKVSDAGLKGLAEVINRRTNIKIAGVRGVDPALDKLFYYPVLYWPMAPGQNAISATAARNIQDYMAQGGMLLIDTRDGDAPGAGTAMLQRLGETIQIAELAKVGEGHILTKSFYLLDAFPGRLDGVTLWAEKEPSANYDSVTSVIIGGGDWASVWALDSDAPAGGERQREMAYRFGVNAVMVALAGSYKADQLHIPYILERLHK